MLTLLLLTTLLLARNLGSVLAVNEVENNQVFTQTNFLLKSVH